MKKTIKCGIAAAIVVVVVFVAFQGCGSREDLYYNPDKILVDERNDYTDSIILKDVNELYNEVKGLYSIDNYLILVQDNKDSIFQVLDINSGTCLASFGKVGHAHNEFQSSPWKVYCVRDEKGEPMLCIQDIKCTKVVDIKKSVDEGNCVISKIIKEKKDYLFDYTYYFAENKWFNYKTVSYEDARDLVYIKPMFYMNNETDNGWDLFPQIINPTVTSLVECAYAMNLFVSPNGRYVVGIQNYIDNVTVFDISKKRSIGIINPDSYTLQDLESEFNENNIKEKLIWYNTSGCATDNYFMVIKDGDFYRNVAHEDSEDGTSVINWYDWTGEKQSSYVLNKKLSYIAYDEKTSILYAISNANKLYYYRLSVQKKP